MESSVAHQLMDLAGGDKFGDVRQMSEDHQRRHGCGLHNAGGPQMQLVAALARAANVKTVVDLGCGLGYSTLWLADAVGKTGHVIGIDDDPGHIAEAERIAGEFGWTDQITYRTGRVADVLQTLDGSVDMIHDDAWFATEPEHLETMIRLVRPGGIITMVNWFLLVDALTGEPRNDWEAFAGPNWAHDVAAYAQLLADREDISINWITSPPVALVTKS